MSDSDPFLLPSAYVQFPFAVPPGHKVIVTGPGMVKAVQVTHAARRALIQIWKLDARRRIIGFGYTWAEPDELPKSAVRRPPTWIEARELQFRLVRATQDDDVVGSLELEYTAPERRDSAKTEIIQITLNSTTDLGIRAIRRTRDTGADFMIQAELVTRGRGLKRRVHLVRYDSAHGTIHRDLYLTSKQAKTSSETSDPALGIPWAIEDLRTHLPDWLEKKGCPELAEVFRSNAVVAKEWESMKSRLMKLMEDDELTRASKSKLTIHAIGKDAEGGIHTNNRVVRGEIAASDGTSSGPIEFTLYEEVGRSDRAPTQGLFGWATVSREFATVIVKDIGKPRSVSVLAINSAYIEIQHVDVATGVVRFYVPQDNRATDESAAT